MWASTHLPQTAGDKDFWHESLFVAELDNLIDHLKLRDGPGFHLFGLSWGGLLGVAFAARQPRGLQRLVLASGLASMDLSEKSIQLCRSELPIDVQEVLNKCVQEADYKSQAYRDAMEIFQKDVRVPGGFNAGGIDAITKASWRGSDCVWHHIS